MSDGYVPDGAPPAEQYVETSAELDQFADALAKAQAEMKNPSFDATNTFYSVEGKEAKYATLAAIRDAVVPALGNHGICVMQIPYASRPQDGPTIAGVVTFAVHSSGQWVRSRIGFRPMRASKGQPPQPCDDAQSVGGATTYARRYALQGFACVVGDHDDDGNSASGIDENQKRAPFQKKEQPYQPTGKPSGKTFPRKEPVAQPVAKPVETPVEPAKVEPAKVEPAKAETPSAPPPTATVDQLSQMVTLGASLNLKEPMLLKAISKYSVEGEAGRTLEDVGPKTADAVIRAMRAKQAAKAEGTPPAEDENRKLVVSKLQKFVKAHSITQAQVQKILNAEFAGVTVSELSTDEMEMLSTRLDEIYTQSPEDEGEGANA